MLQRVQIVDRGDRSLTHGRIDAVRIGHEQHRLPGRSKLDALMAGRQKAASPARFAAIGLALARQQHHERRQVAVFAAEPVAEPRSQAGPADDLMPRVHEDLRRRVIELGRPHRSDDGDVVGDGGEMRHQLRDFRARLAVLRESEWRREELRRPLDEGEPFALDQFLRDVLTVVLLQRRLGIEEIELRRRACHEEIDDALRFRRELQAVRLAAHLGAGHAVEERREREPADPERRPFEEMAARDGAERVAWRSRIPVGHRVTRYILVTASSRFKRMLATIVHAARSARSSPARSPAPATFEAASRLVS